MDYKLPNDPASSEEYLSRLQSLRRNEGWELMCAWLDWNVNGLLEKLVAEKDPTELAKRVGALSAFRALRSRVDNEIIATMEYLKSPS